ncbi:hypothetical protein [Aeromicrobium sp. CTD01-1L150]|uniref:hypothetical protein n=1 Tax=Aeromicrobium sp. CTD01-1L150 TaxID=3341830 RepID=UPI0035C04B4C
MRRTVAALALTVGTVAAGATGVHASPSTGSDITTGPCPYAGCDTWPVPDWLLQ